MDKPMCVCVCVVGVVGVGVGVAEVVRSTSLATRRARATECN